MISPHCRSVSHPSSHLTQLRSLFDRKWGLGRPDSMDVGGGQEHDEDEDRELKHEKANGKVISILPRDSFSLLALTTLGKTSRVAPGVDTPCTACTANDKGGPSPHV
jgi:hypothetical protein